MNINLSSVSDSPKVTKITSEGGEVSSESPESGGFFSKLAALIKGESSPETKVEEAKVSVEPEGEDVSVEGDTEVKSSKASETENQSTDELLSTSTGDDESVKATKSTAESDVANIAKSASDTDDQQSAEKIVADNDEVLQRLDHANKVLQPKDGKPLPQDNKVQAVDASDQDLVVTQKGGVKSEQQHHQSAKVLESTADDGEKPSGQKVVVSSAEGEEVVIPASAKRFVDQQSIKHSEVQPAQEKLSNPARLVAAKQHKGSDSHNDMLEEPIQVQSAPTSVESELPQAVHEEVVEVGAAAVVAAGGVLGASAVTTASATEALDSAAEPVSVSSQTLSSDSVEGEAELDANSPQVTVSAAAIPWTTQLEGQAKDEVAIKADTSAKAQHTPIAQSVHQAVVNQQSSAQLVQSAGQQAIMPTMPTDLAAAQMQQAVVAPNAAVAQEQALMKAVMGAKAAGTLGQVGSNKESAQQGSETGSGFAQQLAQASGQQGPGALAQVRAEQAAQAPLQLSRELASDQVAERVQMMMSKNLKNIDIRLDPPELGRMQIRMHMNGDAATVHFTVANQQARDVIEQSMPRLREMLAQQGVQLGDSSVQQQAAGQQQRRYADSGQGNNGQGNSSQGFSGEENLEPDINLDLNVATKRDGISYYA
ncbi:flagellar hook-length control protein FliK [Vibrio galatheae]|uniref:Flagellar hook-length control protein FliK n=1 Tax=Vibrio galatheae TaxID=579748 RepID=A0A0F4NKS7_9VIBR|nr:flagellar hook-length control protein FliK [Vibrio galatheae]KJY83785.1 flagellar hook-length control protein FliK [Vibrio galatheae]